MFQDVPVRHSVDFSGVNLSLETGLLANQANSSVLATLGETTVLAAVVVGKETSVDYFPLQVIYEERMYASGKIKGSRFIKREGRPSESAILTGRMIDRSLRSLFDKNIRSEVQVVITVLSIDEVNPPDILCVLAASAALKIAIKDFQGHVSSVRIGQLAINGATSIVNSIKEKVNSGLDFDQMREILIDACRVLEIHDEDQRKQFREIFDLLGAKNPDWANKLKEIYQQESRGLKQETLSKYSSSYTSVALPTYEQMASSELDLVVSGDGDNIMMVEAGANIINEDIIGSSLDVAAVNLKKLTKFQTEFIEKVGAEMNIQPKELVKKEADPKYVDYWLSYGEDLENVLYMSGSKEEKADALNDLKQKHLNAAEKFAEMTTLITADSDLKENISQIIEKQDADLKSILNSQANIVTEKSELTTLKSNLQIALDKVIQKLVHTNVLEKDRRLDGRRLDETRKIICQIGVLPMVHGSSLFQRGETQVLNVLTLGTSRDAQLLDDMEDFEEQTKRYIHHYNFPAYSVGETGRYFGPGRREIGHGALAEKALLPVLPTEEEFPYTLRLVSECLGSNGSTSMASTCGSCLSLLEGGVPIKDLVAGVAMGLILDSQSGKFKVLTDIQGSEDHYGDMDFKVTGTKNGITAIQLDNKVAGLTTEILKQALVQSKAARMHILGIMNQAINQARPEVSKYAPGVITLQVPVDKIGEVIGPSGKIIKSIIARYQVDVDIEDNTGKTFIYGKDRDNVAKAADTIKKLIKEYKVGDSVGGKVFRIESYGAFVKIDDTDKEGMIHISQISEKRVNNINEVITMGQELQAKVVEINDKGQISLTLK